MSEQEALWSATEVRTQAEQCAGQITVWEALDETETPARPCKRCAGAGVFRWEQTCAQLGHHKRALS